MDYDLVDEKIYNIAVPESAIMSVALNPFV